MKKTIFFFALVLTVLSCKQNKDSASLDENDQLIRGEFILIDNAGVIKGEDFIYGVVIDEKATELQNKIKPLQREAYDMVPVVVKGNIKPNPNEGWEEIVQITEIIGVTEPTSELPTKINSSEEANTTGESGHEGHNH